MDSTSLVLCPATSFGSKSLTCSSNCSAECSSTSSFCSFSNTSLILSEENVTEAANFRNSCMSCNVVCSGSNHGALNNETSAPFPASLLSDSSSSCDDTSAMPHPVSSLGSDSNRFIERPIEMYLCGFKNQEVIRCSQTKNFICKFKKSPERLLLIKRHNSALITNIAAQLIRYVTEKFNMKVIVEPNAVSDMLEVDVRNIITWKDQIEMNRVTDLVDIIAVIGGDGTILWTSHLFPRTTPPVVGFSMGSLGYLNQFNISDTKNVFNSFFYSHYHVTLRCRLCVRVMSEKGEVVKELCAMNECILDRGPSPFLTMLDVYCNETFFTTVSADGLILATPTGSTAYSMSAGGAIVHPKVPCILFTPVSPHSLSFRPVILPDSVTLRVLVPVDSRYNAWVAVDGRSRTELKKGMYVLISMSGYPLPMVIKDENKNGDGWLKSLTKGLNWNQRIRQAPICASSSEGKPFGEDTEKVDKKSDRQKLCLSQSSGIAKASTIRGTSETQTATVDSLDAQFPAFGETENAHNFRSSENAFEAPSRSYSVSDTRNTDTERAKPQHKTQSIVLNEQEKQVFLTVDEFLAKNH